MTASTRDSASPSRMSSPMSTSISSNPSLRLGILEYDLSASAARIAEEHCQQFNSYYRVPSIRLD
jgi:hypothetical protein